MRTATLIIGFVSALLGLKGCVEVFEYLAHRYISAVVRFLAAARRVAPAGGRS
jgi:hypothetical protein